MAFIGFLIYLFICLGIMFSPILAIAAIERGREPDWVKTDRLNRQYQEKMDRLRAQLEARKREIENERD